MVKETSLDERTFKVKLKSLIGVITSINLRIPTSGYCEMWAQAVTPPDLSKVVGYHTKYSDLIVIGNQIKISKNSV